MSRCWTLQLQWCRLLLVAVVFLGILLTEDSSVQAQPEQQPQKCHKNSLVVPAGSVLHRRTHSNALIIAHRGASYHVPEHSLAAYRLALELGADFMEPDLVASQDGVLFAMHSVDLNVTTNVEQLFGATQGPWYSPTANRTGYWSFNFTWAQIQTLRLSQRLPVARTTMYDGLLAIPSLAQILELIHHWNTVDLPATVLVVNVTDNNTQQQQPSPLQKYQAGLYVEFKQSAWIQNETGMDLVDLLYDNIAAALSSNDNDTANNNNNDTSKYWKHLLPCFESVRFDEYIVPGLVLQSFNATDLERFHQKWQHDKVQAAEPPYVLLVDKQSCWQDKFWFEVGDKWRSFLSGIGCEKSCLLLSNSTSTSSDAATAKEENEKLEEERQHINAFTEKASEFGLVLHPWTERPELQYMSPLFNNSLQEMQHLLCNVPGVHGIFTESVDIAVRAAQLPCNNTDDNKKQHDDTSTSTTTRGNSSGLCYESQAEANVYVGFASFVMGVFVALLTSLGWMHCKRRRRRSYTRATPVPTNEVDEETSDLELT
jgi:glycerophosphoryl diester phosphodiesterase